MAHPDILADPTAELEAILNGTRGPGCLVDWLALHRHILAGGALPAQWRGPGTAVGNLIAEVEFRADEMHKILVIVNEARRALDGDVVTVKGGS